MCTVVCQWRPGAEVPIRILALRDEFASRAFDKPGRSWPAQPTVVGGRDRLAGGTWCAATIDTASTAVVLNRPERPVAKAGAASRGVLPLLAVRELAEWPRAVDFESMASFNLVLAIADELRWWSWDGSALASRELDVGTYKFTPTRLEVAPAEFGDVGALDDLNGPTAAVWREWLALIDNSAPSPEPGALIVERPVGADSYETVFGQFLLSRPGALRVDYAFRPRRAAVWTTERWTASGHTANDGRR